ncbi:MAG TPA: carboxymuconolactone decarboxylase family protein [Clostridiaceae bacterium]|nr:carboxymuconolactone decarboxylase family protein [Clostridiaceae bacterium]
MRDSYPKFIQDLKKSDPKFFEQIAEIFELAMAPGELDSKTKILIAMTLDALSGAKEGVRLLSKVARHMGVSDNQIAEALRIAYLVAGNTVLAASNAAFSESDD